MSGSKLTDAGRIRGNNACESDKLGFNVRPKKISLKMLRRSKTVHSSQKAYLKTPGFLGVVHLALRGVGARFPKWAARVAVSPPLSLDVFGYARGDGSAYVDRMCGVFVGESTC